MKLSPLQIARYQYTPKLPGMLRGGIATICVKEGLETTSVADQEKIKALFPNTYGKKEITKTKSVCVSHPSINDFRYYGNSVDEYVPTVYEDKVIISDDIKYKLICKEQ